MGTSFGSEKADVKAYIHWSGRCVTQTAPFGASSVIAQAVQLDVPNGGSRAVPGSRSSAVARSRHPGATALTLVSMADNALRVAVLTGGTAVAASWVTSRGNARAARIQAEASAQAQQLSRAREVRRTAYLEFIEQAHITGELHWRLGDIYAQLADPH